MSIFNTYMETDIFLIRNIKPIDKKFILKHFTTEAMCTHLSYVSNDESFEEFLCWSNSKNELAKHNKWIVLYKKDETPIGTIGFNHISRETKTAQIEYEMAKDYWAKGYTIQLMEKILLFGFKKLMLRKLNIQFTKANSSMHKSLMKMGFVETDMLFDENYVSQKYGDDYHLTITLESYQDYLSCKSVKDNQYFSKATIIFPTLDMEKTRDFYVEHLGFTALYYYSDDSRHINLQKDEVEIALVDSNALEIIPNRVLHQSEFLYDAFFYVSNIDLLYKELKKNNIKIVADRQVTNFSNKEFAIEDCDGRWIGIGMIM